MAFADFSLHESVDKKKKKKKKSDLFGNGELEL